MSCNSYAYVIVGLRVSGDLLEKTLEDIRKSKSVSKKGCLHEFDKKAKFCPECGKPKLIIEEAKEIDIETWIAEMGLEFATTTGSLNYFLTTDKKWMGYTSDINCGETYDSIAFPSSKDIDKIRDTLMAKLCSYDLWVESQFRIWVVGYCSY